MIASPKAEASVRYLLHKYLSLQEPLYKITAEVDSVRKARYEKKIILGINLPISVFISNRLDEIDDLLADVSDNLIFSKNKHKTQFGDIVTWGLFQRIH